ncbi:beta-N-acetylhexosaminidase [Rhodobacteraceae bacterium XHP0102]|nr:beta-N-acetylhexosaminidase [Rhodobacteraceae bacterium XHP0102]
MPAPFSATILGLTGPRLTKDEARFFQDANPWGFILFARNIENPDQLRALCAELRMAVGWDAPVLIDQEGGRVQRMGPPHWRQWTPPLDMIAARDRDSAMRALYLRAALIGHEMRACGLDVNCAPLADVARDGTHAVLKNRLYGTTPESVADFARAYAQGLRDAGVAPVLKHLPGYGLGQVDSHLSCPRVATPQSELERIDFAAFKPLIDLPMGMSAHIIYEAIDPDHPATLSPIMIEIIRSDIGFDGLLMTDDISMGALGGSLAERCHGARAAGCDVILHCNGEMTDMIEVVSATGHLDQISQARANRALLARDDARALDISALEAELRILSEKGPI